MTTALGSAYGKIVLDSSGVTTGINMAANVLTQFESTTKRIGASIAQAGDRLTQSLTIPLAGLGVASGKAAMGFEASMQQIVGLVGVSQQQVTSWSQQLLALGPALGRGPKELADALYFTTSAGLKTGEALDVVKKAGMAASAGLGETQVIADATSSALNAYGTANLSAGKAVGILVATVREGKAEASAIAPALGRVIPIAAQLGISFDQVGAAMAAMTRVGFDASESATNLSGIMSALLKPSKQASDVMAEFGLSGESLRQTLKEKGLLGVLTLLKDTIGQDDEALAKIFPNIRGFRGLLSLVGENAAQTQVVFKNLAATTEQDLNKAFEVASNTAKFKFDAAMATAQSGLIKFGTAVLPAIIPLIQDLAKTLENVTTWFSNLSPATQQSIVQALALVAALGPVMSIGGRLISTFGTLAGVFRTVAGVVVTAVSGFGKLVTTGVEVVQYLVEAGAAGVAVIGMFAALAAALVVIVKFFDAASRAAHATNEELIAMAHSNTGNVIEDAFNRAGAAAEVLMNGSQRLKEAFIAHQDEMQKKLANGETTTAEYNAEIERSAKLAGLWGGALNGTTGQVTQIDGAVKIFTADQAMAMTVTRGYADIEAIRAQRVAASTSATGDLATAMQGEVDAANAAAEAQKNLAADVDAGGAMLERLKALMDGPVGAATKEYTSKQEELKGKIAELVAEQSKLLGTQGQTATANQKTAMTTDELAAAEAKRTDVLAVMTAGARKRNESDTAYAARMKGLQVQYDNLTAKIGGTSAATGSFVDNSKRLGEISTELDGLNKDLADNGQAYDDRLKKILFDMTAERLAVDGTTTAEASALIALALKMGSIDQATADMQMGVLAATDRLSNGGTLDGFMNDLDKVDQKAGGTGLSVANSVDTMVGKLKASGQDYDAEALDMAQHADDAAAKVKTAEDAKLTAFITAAGGAKTATGDVIAAVDEEALAAERDAARTNTAIGGIGTAATTASGVVQTQMTGMQTATSTMASQIGVPLSQAAGSFSSMAAGVATASGSIPPQIAGIQAAASTMASQIGDPLSMAAGSFSSMAAGVATAGGAVQSQMAGMQTATATALSGIQSTFTQYGPSIGAPLATAIGTVQTQMAGALAGISSSFAQYGPSIGTPLASGMQTTGQTIQTGLKG